MEEHVSETGHSRKFSHRSMLRQHVTPVRQTMRPIPLYLREKHLRRSVECCQKEL